MGLMEIVTEPDFEDALDSYSFAREVALVLRSIGTCDAQMGEGGFRVDVNVSVHKQDKETGEILPGVRVELKNLNSFSAVLKATEYEIRRQKEMFLKGEKIEYETRTYNSETGKTVSIRSKEDQYDYRFMPEPNLLPLLVYSQETFASKSINQDLVITDEYLDMIKGSSEKFYVDFDKGKD